MIVTVLNMRINNHSIRSWRKNPTLLQENRQICYKKSSSNLQTGRGGWPKQNLLQQMRLHQTSARRGESTRHWVRLKKKKNITLDTMWGYSLIPWRKENMWQKKFSLFRWDWPEWWSTIWAKLLRSLCDPFMSHLGLGPHVFSSIFSHNDGHACGWHLKQ